MATGNLTNWQVIKNAVIFGFISVIVILITGRFTLDNKAKYTGNPLTTTLTFVIIFGGIILCFISLIKIRKAGNLTVGQIALAGLFFSLAAGFTGGLYHYVNAAFLDPGYAEKALEAARANWIARHYPKEAIAGQAELTDNFRNPITWAISSGFFLSTCIFLSSLLLGGLFKVMERGKWKLHWS